MLLRAYVNWWKKKHSQSTLDHTYDYVMERGTKVRGASDPVEIKVNEAYGTHGQDIDDRQANDTSGLDLESEAVEASSHYEEVH